MNLENLISDIRKHGDRKKAELLKRYFKTGPGEYAEGDIFIGIKVPALRAIAKKYRYLSFNDTLTLLKSDIHEERFVALLLLMHKYRCADAGWQKKIYKAYLAHTKYINNWDLVDVSAKHVVGGFLMDKDRTPVHELAHSASLWERRIAVLATFYFIGHGDFDDALKISEILINDRHDLIHKAVGWMLREVGKKDMDIEEKFLKKYCAIMPRTMLRYAIERFPGTKRMAYLRAKMV
ncbi:MAG: DNA alkylation repair protein [Candidatus Omnitrophica bacterium]|nr:DNA alkylation repair protein [Candidatus Omnitrophota bacterium]